MSERFRHEDIASVPAGWKVRTVTTSGGHRVRVAFPPGRRVKGAGRLVSILHPLSGSNPCGNPCSLRSNNPQELMVMSANPPRTRQNAGQKQKLIAYGLGFNHAVRGKKFDDKYNSAVRAYPEEYRKGYTFGQERLRGSGQNPHELLIMGANPRVEVVHGENPPVEDIHEEFTGQEVKWKDIYNEPHMPAGRYAELGPLIALYVKPVKGGPVLRIGAPESHIDFAEYWDNKPPIIVTDSTAKQIYFVDGCQDISALLEQFGAQRGEALHLYQRPQAYLWTLGQVRRIDYQCRKEHVAHPEEDLWKHDHGEEDGQLPTLVFDQSAKRLLYLGGNYRIEGPWIRN